MLGLPSGSSVKPPALGMPWWSVCAPCGNYDPVGESRDTVEHSNQRVDLFNPTDHIGEVPAEASSNEFRPPPLDGIALPAQCQQPKAEDFEGNGHLQEDDADVGRLVEELLEGRIQGMKADWLLELQKANVKQARTLEDMASQVPVGHTTSRLVHDVSEFRRSYRYTCEKSTWDACLFICLPGLHIGDSGLTVLAVVISAVIEGLFCVLLFNMTKSPVGEEDVTQLLSWRVRHGQNVEYLGTYSTSLTRRLCLGELSMEAAALQHGVNSQFIDYLANQSGSLPINGVWLSALTNALWTFFFLKELKSIGAFVVAVQKRCGDATRFIVETGGANDSFKFESISPRRRNLLLLLVVFPRFCIASVLYVAGAQFLIYTHDLSNLLLNAIGLGFILRISDTIFECLVPRSVKVILELAEPMNASFPCTSVRKSPIDLRVVGSIMVGIILCFGVDRLFLSHFVDDMRSATNVLCSTSSNLDFVYALNPANSLVYYAKSEATLDWAADTSRTQEARYQYDAVLKITKVNMPAAGALTNSNLSKLSYAIESSLDSLGHMHRLTAQEAADEMDCNDISSNSSTRGLATYHAAQILFDYMGFPTMTDCNDVRSLCDQNGSRHVARSLCPVTCGCSDPAAGIFDLSGCPSNCESSRDSAEFRGCLDLPIEVLGGDAGWMRFWREYEAGVDWAGIDDLLNALNAASIPEAAARFGCGWAELMGDLPVEDPCDGAALRGDVETFCPQTCQATVCLLRLR